MNTAFKTFLFFYFLFFLSFYAFPIYAGTLSCTIRSTVCNAGEVSIYRMSGSSNAHAELGGQTTPSYDNNIVCCGGVSGIGNSCVGNHDVALRLSKATNAHVQQNNLTNPNYASNLACISVPVGGNVMVGYQANNCSSPVLYDTIVGSMSKTTNAHVGDTSAYTTKICATGVGPESLTFSLSNNSVGFGTLVSGGARYATANSNGSSSDTLDAHTLSASTNAVGGYIVTIGGTTLTAGANIITPIGATATVSNPAIEQFGLRMVVNSGTGTVSAPYNTANWALDTTAFPDQVVSGTGDNTITVFGIRYLANISPNTKSGDYNSILTYSITASF